MFVYSMRAGTVRFFGVLCVSLAVLVALIAFVPELQPAAATNADAEDSAAIRYDGIRTEEERIAFLARFGWEVAPQAVESTTVRIPTEFDKVFAAYNELQRTQGLDLSDFGGKTVERHTYTVTNYPGYEGTVYANLLIFRGRVIGGDICSADPDGFLQGFEKKA